MPEWKDQIRRRLASVPLSEARRSEIVEELSQDADDRYEALLRSGMTAVEAEERLRHDLADSIVPDVLRSEAPPLSEPAVLGAGTMIVVASTVVHGLTATPGRLLYRRAARSEDQLTPAEARSR